jgi:flagellar basal-body rod modification protein FlgD
MATTTQLQGVGVQNTLQAQTTSGILGKDDFLKMLITQLRHQDPLNPMDGTDFAAQLAQFSSLEQLANINSSLSESIVTNQYLTQAVSNTMSASLIGHEVRATASSFEYSGDSQVKFGYELPANAKTAVVKIYDQNNQLVRTINGGTDKGQQTVTWDGKNEQGSSMAAGTYHFTVDAPDVTGTAQTVGTYIFGTVSAVRFKSTGAVFVIDGAEIPLADILEIMKG